MTTESKTKSVLFLTNSEYGQAQVHLAIAHELLVRSDLQVHFASFPALHSGVCELQKLHPSNPIRFHPINEGPSTTEAMSKNELHGWENLSHPCGIAHAVKALTKLPYLLSPRGWEGHFAIYQRCAQIIKDIEPSMVVVDCHFNAGVDMCRNWSNGEGGERMKYILINPVDLIHMVGMVQPSLGAFWKYPAFCSGFPFPVPWYLVLANIYLQIRLIGVFLFAPRFRTIDRCRKVAGLVGKYPLIEPWRADEEYLCPSLPELEAPSIFVPTNVTTCGPIMVTARGYADSDPELAEWLQRRPTILINLGSHVQSEGSDAVELAKGVRVVLGRRQDLQVLWKLQCVVTDDLKAILGAELESDGRVKIRSWLETDPVSLLQSGHVVCSVHHGGANSFYEAVGSGVPQVVLPVWYDTYDFANRVEYLGIGLWASKITAPHIDADDFSRAVMAVVDKGEAGLRRRVRARELGEVCQKAGGRERACAKIIELVGSEPKKS